MLDAKTCRAKYKFKIENVTQLLEFHALSDHQTVPVEIVELTLQSATVQSDDRIVRETQVTVLNFLS